MTRQIHTHSNNAKDADRQFCLSVRDLRTHFFCDEGVVKAVDGVSFDVFPGRTLAIVGESGCGKSVANRAVLRIVDPPGRIVEGEILFRRRPDNGQENVVDLARLDERGREMRAIRGKEIALIFQEPMSSFSPVHTVGSQIMEAITLHEEVGKPEARRKAVAMLRKVGVPEPQQRIDAYPHQLSGGLRQRAMIAMALSCNPGILIADEPTTALDVTTQAQILDLLRTLQRDTGMAVIFITHDLGVVAQMADDVLVMYLGRGVERAGVDDIFHDARHPYTRALLQSIPRVSAGPRAKLASIEGAIPHPFNRPAGCPFHNRCASFIPGTCDRHEPRMQPVGDGHEVSCFLHHPPGET